MTSNRTQTQVAERGMCCSTASQSCQAPFSAESRRALAAQLHRLLLARCLLGRESDTELAFISTLQRDFLLTTLPPPAGSAYYDNVRPLAYPDSDAVLICFDISRPETLDSVLKKWQGETQEFCPNAKIVLVGCKLDMRTDLNTLRELSKQRLIPVTHEQGSALARQIGAVAYAECSSKVSENSVRDVFHVTTLASVNRVHKNLKRSNSKRGLKRASQMPGRTDLLNDTEIRKDRAKSCSIM
uniref:Rho family GTPase 2 n=1 Tax=Athene cunicularia TaxID=194338 RepID=A0A663MK73_ATHCN